MYRLLGLLILFKASTCLAQSSSDEPTKEEIAWLCSAIIPIQSVYMNANDSDLQCLKRMIGDTHVVALGENTHGSSEIYKIKDRMIKYLVEKDGFNVFAIEAAMPEAYRLNDYIIDGTGDPKELIKGMYFWTWDTQEMLDLVNWMKAYNANHEKKVMFTGFDVQEYKGAIENIKVILKEQ